jgi:tRNA(fMet)-specific endonuclease VapC
VALLIDTTALIAVERGRSREAATLGDVLPGDPDEIVAIAAITASELLVGVHRARTDAQRARREAFVEAMLVRIPVVPFDLLCARMHARLAGSLAGSGASIGAHDLQIAATALAHGFRLVTANLREFRRVPGLLVAGLKSGAGP